MIWIYAKSVITAMTNHFSVGNFTFENKVCSPVCKVRFSFVLYLTVASVILACVNNAAIRLISRMCSKLTFYRFFKRRGSILKFLRHALSRTKFKPVEICGGRVANNSGTAVRADNSFCSHRSHYTHGGLNGYEQRAELWEAAKGVLA